MKEGMQKKIEGIVVSTVDYKESSKIINILTPDEGIVGFELYDELFEKAGGKMDNDKGRHFASLSCPMNELQKIAEYLSFEFKKMEINPFELSEEEPRRYCNREKNHCAQ